MKLTSAYRWVLRRLARRPGDERGQALPMAAVGIFAMVLGVLATLNLGQAVHQKIRLQNSADSAAYTLAAMEARTFNYIAFLNRAQIAHYNTAMVVQSYMTWVGFQTAMYVSGAGLLEALKGSAETGEGYGCPYLGCIYIAPYAILSILSGLNQAMMQIAVQIYQLIAERLGHPLVEAMTIFNNSSVWQTQLSRAAILNAHIMTGVGSIVGKNEPDLGLFQGKSKVLNTLVNAALNSIEYYQTFDNASGVNPSLFSVFQDYFQRARKGGKYNKHSDDPAKDAYRIMTELCHATRTPEFVSKRTSPGNITVFPVTITGTKKGQTKLTEKGSMDGAEISAIRSEGNYGLGIYLSSDDFLDNAIGVGNLVANVGPHMFKSGELGDAIAAYETKGKHYRAKSDSGILVAGGQNPITLPPASDTASEAQETENHAPWPGYAPFFKFKPKADRTADFNQPSTWVFLNKHHKDFQTDSGSHGGQAPWYSNFSWKNGTQTADLNTAIGDDPIFSILPKGLTVLSRGMAYYHRPGNWNEHPNFFNPYWRARLAPVGQKLQNFWDRWVTQNISTSSDSKVIQAMVNFLRNAQMDVFTAAITSLITH